VPFISIKNLTHVYGAPGLPEVHALRGIDLEINAGERIAMLGANGSGKTTLALHMNAILVPTSGTVDVGGFLTTDESARARIRSGVGMVFQSPVDQIVATTVEDDVAFGPENLGVPRAEITERVRESLERVGMWEERKRSPYLLSAGQQQRVAIAGVLAMRPRCILLDEATSMLDPAASRGLLGLLGELNGEGITIISITHRMEEAVSAGRIVVLASGRVAFDGPPRDAFAQDVAKFGLSLPPAARIAGLLSKSIPGFPRGLSSVREILLALEEAAG
jgi:energy-coupling factor transporter ATPase